MKIKTIILLLCVCFLIPVIIFIVGYKENENKEATVAFKMKEDYVFGANWVIDEDTKTYSIDYIDSFAWDAS